MLAGGTQRNHAFVSEHVDWGTVGADEQFLLADAQTSGGLSARGRARASRSARGRARTSCDALAAAVIGHTTVDGPGTMRVRG